MAYVPFKRLREDSTTMSSADRIEKIKSGKFELADVLVGIFEKLEETNKNVNDIFSAQNETNSKLETIPETIQGISQEVTTLRTEFDDMKLQIIRLESDSVSSNIILRNLKYHPNAQPNFETISQTEAVVSQFLHATSGGKDEIMKQIGFLEVRRFAKNKRLRDDPDPKKTAPVKVKLISSRAVNSIFGFLPNLKNTEFEKVRVTKEVPPSLMKLNNELETQGKALRDSEGGQTKVIQRGLTMVLRHKPVGSTTYVDVKRKT